jgi:hypothetical protein
MRSPANYSERKTELWGFQAAGTSLALLFVPPVGLIAAPSNPLFLFAVYAMYRGRYGWCVALSCLAAASMIGAGLIAPNQPGEGPLRFPGGTLAVGYYVWLSSGLLLFVCAIVQFVRSKAAR